jgi:hypothetical protein
MALATHHAASFDTTIVTPWFDRLREGSYFAYMYDILCLA